MDATPQLVYLKPRDVNSQLIHWISFSETGFRIFFLEAQQCMKNIERCLKPEDILKKKSNQDGCDEPQMLEMKLDCVGNHVHLNHHHKLWFKKINKFCVCIKAWYLIPLSVVV